MIDENTELSELDIDVPAWIDQDITVGDIEAITQGGCASGAYMPAVTYHTAKETMNEYGDDILQYMQDNLGELPRPKDDESWAGMACFYVSCAVELWAAGLESEIEEKKGAA